MRAAFASGLLMCLLIAIPSLNCGFVAIERDRHPGMSLWQAQKRVWRVVSSAEFWQ